MECGEIQVERRNLDDAQLVGFTIALNLDDIFLGCLLFQHHLVTNDGDDTGVMLAGAAGGNNLQIHAGAFGATDLVNHFIQTQADHRSRRIFFLGYPDNAVGGLELTTLGSRTTGHQAHHLGVAVFVLQHRTDTFKRAAHADIKVFRIVRRKVSGVRIKGLCQSIDIDLEHVFRRILLDTL